MASRNTQAKSPETGKFFRQYVRDGKWEYGYDTENRLVWMQTRGDYIVGGLLIGRRLEFVYDYLGRRVKKTEYLWGGTEAGWGQGVETLYRYRGWNLIAEYAGAEEGVSEGATLLRTHSWGLTLDGELANENEGGALLFMQEVGGSGYYAGTDGKGNLTVLLESETGELAASYEYDAYGELLRAKGTYANENPWRFGTKYADRDSGLVYYGHRYYSPRNGRFINRDPIGEEGGWNLYGMSLNNPVNYVDRLGLYCPNRRYLGQDCGFCEWCMPPEDPKNALPPFGVTTTPLDEYEPESDWDIGWNTDEWYDDIYDEFMDYYTSWQSDFNEGAMKMADAEILRSEGMSLLGKYLRKIPLLGGMLGAAGDMITGVTNMLISILSFGQIPLLQYGFDQFSYGIGQLIDILARDVAAVVIGMEGKLVTTMMDILNILTLGQYEALGHRNKDGKLEKSGFLKSIGLAVFDLIIPNYGFFGGGGWGYRQFGDNRALCLNNGDVASYMHDYNDKEGQWIDIQNRNWLLAQWVGPAGAAYALLGTFTVFGIRDLFFEKDEEKEEE